MKLHIKNPNDFSLVKMCVNNESNEFNKYNQYNQSIKEITIQELLHQIPHFIFPIGGLYVTTIPRLLLILVNHSDKFQKVCDSCNKLYNYMRQNSQNSQKSEKLISEKIYGLTYLRKCISETLRLNNP